MKFFFSNMKKMILGFLLVCSIPAFSQVQQIKISSLSYMNDCSWAILDVHGNDISTGHASPGKSPAPRFIGGEMLVDLGNGEVPKLRSFAMSCRLNNIPEVHYLIDGEEFHPSKTKLHFWKDSDEAFSMMFVFKLKNES